LEYETIHIEELQMGRKYSQKSELVGNRNDKNNNVRSDVIWTHPKIPMACLLYNSLYVSTIQNIIFPEKKENFIDWIKNICSPEKKLVTYFKTIDGHIYLVQSELAAYSYY
jgi:hypothetical protein